MRYSLPEHHRKSFQNLPYTTDPKYPVPIPHRKVASLLSPPDLPQISAACCGYSHCPYRSDNRIPHNPPSSPVWPASPHRRSHASPAPPSPADTPDSRCRSRFPLCWWPRRQSESDRQNLGERQMLPWQMKSTFIIVIVYSFLSGNALFCKGFQDYCKML